MIQNFLVLPKGRDIKAARNYLDWNQMKLAVSCDLNIGTITAIEKEERYPTVENLKKIAQVFLDAGIRFHSQGGFIHDNEVVKIYEGVEGYLKILEDVLQTCSSNKDEVLFLGNDDKRSTFEINEMHKKIYKEGIPYKYLIAEDNDYILGQLEDYRKIDKNFFLSNDVIVIYNNKVMFPANTNKEKNSMRIIVIKDQGMSSMFKKYFYRLWNNGKKPFKSETKQIFFKKTKK